MKEMINLDLKEVLKGEVLVLRIYGKELIKLRSEKEMKAVRKCLHVIGVPYNAMHVYKLTIKKVKENV